MPPIDVCNAVAVRTVFLLSLITPVQHGSNAGQRTPARREVIRLASERLCRPPLPAKLHFSGEPSVAQPHHKSASQRTRSQHGLSQSHERDDDRLALGDGSRHPRRLRRKNLWLSCRTSRGSGARIPSGTCSGRTCLSRPRRKWLLLTVMDSGDTPDYLARTHHIRRVPDFWSVTGSPLKKLICQATMSSLGSGVLVQ